MFWITKIKVIAQWENLFFVIKICEFINSINGIKFWISKKVYIKNSIFIKREYVNEQKTLERNWRVKINLYAWKKIRKIRKKKLSIIW